MTAIKKRMQMLHFNVLSAINNDTSPCVSGDFGLLGTSEELQTQSIKSEIGNCYDLISIND